MQLDSHRQRRFFNVPSTPSLPSPLQPPSATVTTEPPPRTCADMHCAWSPRRCGDSDMTATVDEDGVPMESWRSIRRHHLRMLRKEVRYIVLMMALIETLRVDPVQIVYAGRQGYAPRGPEDYGIAYNVGYFLNWLYLCAFMIVFVPLFSWWVPTPSPAGNTRGTFGKIHEILTVINSVLLPATVYLSLGRYIYHVIMTIVYVDSRPLNTFSLPANNKKNWLVRMLLLASVGMSLSFGYGAFQILEAMDLAHVKGCEYYMIVTPVQINLGLLFGSWMQWRVEKRIEKMKLAASADKAAEEALLWREKDNLLVEVK